MPQPRVFKMGGAWVWRCQHPEGPVGEEYFEDRWAQPWAVCQASAVKHTALYHPAGSEPADELEVP